jgi:DNA polymerase III alpha subunit (gram-positive type)
LNTLSKNIEKGDLCLRDLGYYKLSDLESISDKEAYYVSRLKSYSTVYCKDYKVSKDKKLVIILELAMEMTARGFTFHPVDIYKSDAQKFTIIDRGLALPFSALPNVGVSAAQGIVAARQEANFVSVEDFQTRTGLNKTAMEILRQTGCFEGIPESTQISLFG